MSDKVFIIGIDGGTFNFIKPLLAEGKLPTFKKLMDNGVHAVLRSTAPAVTAAAWPTFMTGKNPGKHGLFHFLTFSDSSHGFSVVNAAKCRSKTVFRLASEAGKRVVSINVPVTYPPEELNGIVVSGMLSPKDKTFTYPKELTEELRDLNYEIDIWNGDFDSAEDCLGAVMGMSRRRSEISRKLLTANPWGLAMVVFVGADRLQHKIWDRKDLIRKYYIFLDSLIGELLTLVNDSTYVMIMSDHGFTSAKGSFLVNQWLADIGLLKKRRFPISKPLTRQDLLGRGKRGTLFKLRYFINNVIATLSKGRLLDYPQMSINFKKSRAFSRPSDVIFVNRKEWGFAGTIGAGKECESIRRSIAEKLRELTDPETGENIVEDALIKDDVYSGECFDEAPDIILLPKDDGYAFVDLRSYHSYVERDPRRRSCHSMNGIFFLSGPDTQSGIESDVVEMVDCTPTVLHLLDIPIPEDIDGRVLKELFAPSSATKMREPKQQGSSQISGRAFEGIPEDDEILLAEKLKGLGYF